ncbi:MAG TPA: Ku protein [Ignavibacteriaceae bacterium]|nr:Ku protein [Ignavibacteriaceae bacterium]
MKPLWSGLVSFGLVNIPVKLFSGSRNNTLDLDMLRKGDLCPVRYSRVCRADGKEIPWDDIVKGYEYREGDYVVLDKEDFEKANVKKTKTIDIVDFSKESEIDSIFFEKPYYLEPQKSGMKPYALLREALKNTGKVAVATFVIRQREHVGIIKAYGNLLLLNQLRYHDEIREHKDLDLPDAKELNEKELKMAEELIEKSTAKFKPEEFRDTYIEDLKKIIEAKAKGKKIRKKGKEPSATKVVDLMTQLKKSLNRKKRKRAA